jgi:RNA recognition motif-containing protein
VGAHATSRKDSECIAVISSKRFGAIRDLTMEQVNVHLPKDRVTQTHQGFGFVEFVSEEDAEYAARIMNQVRLYGKPIRVNKVSIRSEFSTLSLLILVSTGISGQAKDSGSRSGAVHW